MITPSEPWVSHTLLQPACEKYFSSEFNSTPWFPGPLRAPHEVPTTQILDVVLFGDFLEELAKFGEWPKKNSYRIWVLCQSARDVLVELVGFEKNQIGVLPRQALFPQITPEHEFPPSDSNFTLVYSGRFVSNKNFDIFLRVASELQTEYGFRNMKVKAYGFYPVLEQELSSTFAYLVLKLKWINAPEFYTEAGPHEWVTDTKGDSVIMSLSKHRREDFGVSVAQAQVAGWPCILSDWGGHRDVSGANVLKIPAPLIPRDSYISKKIDVSMISSFIADNWRNKILYPPVKVINPVPVTLNQFERVKVKLSENNLEMFDRLYGNLLSY